MEEGARLVLRTSASLRAGEKVLVVADETTHPVGEAFLAVSEAKKQAEAQVKGHALRWEDV